MLNGDKGWGGGIDRKEEGMGEEEEGKLVVM